MFHVPNKHRVREGQLGSADSIGNNGVFIIPAITKKNRLRVLASDGLGWEHVSVSLSYRCPRWGEMCRIKDLFWDEEDLVVQFHPPKSEYVNNYPHCLHLWREIGVKLNLPPSWTVGVKDG